MSSPKLVSVEFFIGDEGDMTVVFDAFKKAFPSLQGVKGEDVFDWVMGDEEAGKRVAAALDDSSLGQWYGQAYHLYEHHAGGAGRSQGFYIVPYTEDRFIKIMAPQEPYNQMQLICDYSRRPSLRAASEIIKLAQRAKRWRVEDSIPVLWNDPVWR